MLSAPIDKERGYANNDSYWEGILNYIHNGNNLKKAMSKTGYYISWNRGKKGRNYWCIRPYFIKPHYLPDYYAAKSELNEELFREDKETNLPN